MLEVNSHLLRRIARSQRSKLLRRQVINKKNGALFDSDDENFLSVFAKQVGTPVSTQLESVLTAASPVLSTPVLSIIKSAPPHVLSIIKSAALWAQPSPVRLSVCLAWPVTASSQSWDGNRNASPRAAAAAAALEPSLELHRSFVCFHSGGRDDAQCAAVPRDDHLQAEEVGNDKVPNPFQRKRKQRSTTETQQQTNNSLRLQSLCRTA